MTTERTPFASRRFVLEAVVFTSASVVMILELAGSRLMAPYFGNSLFVWTSLIGVVLAFMSLGNYVGGRLGDRWVDPTMLSWVFGIAALGVVLMSFAENRLLPQLASYGSTRLMAVLSACLLFAVPSMLLGVVSPYSIRLRMHGMEHAGATVGLLYAVGTVGSIAGTFAAGFWLISVLGTHYIILVCALILMALSLAMMGPVDWRKALVLGVALLLALVSWLAAIGSDTVALDTQYDRYVLRTIADPASGRPLIGLSRDRISAESASYEDTGEPYPFEYYSFYDLAALLNPELSNTLLIGGGTLSYPRLFVDRNQGASMDVVEIDGELIDLARERFGFADHPRIRLFLEDGRMFLNRADGPYDAIFMDAFKSEATVPYQLTTLETWKKCYELLEDDGLLVMNVVASPSDERAQFFYALVATIESVFPEVHAYAVQGPGYEGELRNTCIVASKLAGDSSREEIESARPELRGHWLAYSIPAETRLLTDDFAPVDQYLLGLH